MDSDFHSVSKLEAAERQLRQAIRLFFQRGDEVSIHTLAAAAYQVLIDLCKHKNIHREIEDSKILESMGIKDEVIKAFRKPQNFFKHSGSEPDPAATVRFNPMLSACVLVFCISYHQELTGTQFIEGQAFFVWFFLRNPEHLTPALKEWLAKLPPDVDVEDYLFFQELIERMYAAKG